MHLRYLSLFSGIEAASVAFEPLGWEPVAFAEIEPFPCALLKHYWPTIPNLGDVTKITKAQIESLGKIDLVIFGFPCQDVSVAGKRGGMHDADGLLTRSGLFFPAMQIVEWAKPRWALAENVPGLFSINEGSTFASVLGEMAGAEIGIPSDGWENSGFALGPKGLVEWAVLDAQFFGIPQRRRRVFIIRDSGDWRDRPPLLLEPDSLQGHPPPSREAGKSVARTFTSRARSGGWGQDVDLAASGYTQVANSVTPGEGRHWEPSIETLIPDTPPALKARDFKGPSSDGTGDGAPLIPVIANTLRSGPTSEASHGKQSGTDRETLIPIVLDDQGGHAMSVSTDGQVGALRSEAHQHQPVIAVRTAQTGANGEGVSEEVVHTLDGANGQAVCFDTTQVTSKTNRSNPQPGDPCHTLSKDADAPLVVAPAQPIAIHPHVIGRSPTSGPQGKEYLDDGSAYTTDARGTPQSVVYDVRGNGDGNTCPTLSRSAAGDRPNDFAPMVFQSKASASQSMNPADVAPSLDVGKSEGMAVIQNIGGENGTAHEGNTIALLRLLREEVGEETFSKWSLGILIQLYPSEILRQKMHGFDVRYPTEPKHGLVNYALSRKKIGSGWPMRGMWEAGCDGCAPRGWEPSEQCALELGAYLSELPYSPSSAERFMQDLWDSAEGVGVLRQTLSTFQKIWRSICAQDTEKNSNAGYKVRRLVPEETEALQGFPHGYTLVPHRGKFSADGNRYKAIGNSIATLCLSWIGERIEMVEELTKELKK
jgi:DNA (cytosine-5)-methyltransferase 1